MFSRDYFGDQPGYFAGDYFTGDGDTLVPVASEIHRQAPFGLRERKPAVRFRPGQGGSNGSK